VICDWGKVDGIYHSPLYFDRFDLPKVKFSGSRGLGLKSIFFSLNRFDLCKVDCRLLLTYRIHKISNTKSNGKIDFEVKLTFVVQVLLNDSILCGFQMIMIVLIDVITQLLAYVTRSTRGKNN